MRTEARFPGVGAGSGHYESFYIKATRPGGGRAIWIRHTVHKRPGAELTGSIWFTLFDADAAGPRATKVTVPASEVAATAGTLIEVAGAVLEPGRARGEVATPELDGELGPDAIESGPEPFRHLPYSFLYGAPLPKTKFLSPYPDARFSGTVTVDGERYELRRWPGMIGHNWGAEHAERWTWIQANEFAEGEGYFDAALGRIKVGPLTTPWVGNAMLHFGGSSTGSAASTGSGRPASTTGRRAATSSSPARGYASAGRSRSEPRNFVAWVYADPVGPEHNTLNCSISDLELTVERDGGEPQRLSCAGAAAYEIGMRETDHGIPVQPYPDG